MTDAVTESFSDEWALITGSSGGIGSEIARELAETGINLLLHANRHIERAEQLAEKLNQSVKAKAIKCDLSDADVYNSFVEEVSQIAPIEILINAAGADVLTGDAAQWSFSEKLAALWRVDVAATVHLSRLFGAKMKAQGRGCIINIGWDQAEQGMAGDSGEYFAAAKGAVAAFSRSLAKSLAPEVRVNCVAPGWIKTQWGETASQYWQDRARQESLRKRWGTPQDVARVVRFLVSPSADFINGQVINVDGGFAGCLDEKNWS